MPAIHNPPWQNHLRADLRRRQTQAEWKLWYYVCRSQLGVKIRRQHGIGRFIADFYCYKAQLVIEIDGGVHLRPDVRERDREKEAFLNELGLTVLRFTNHEVLCNIDMVLAKIRSKLQRSVLPWQGEKSAIG